LGTIYDEVGERGSLSLIFDCPVEVPVDCVQRSYLAAEGKKKRKKKEKEGERERLHRPNIH